MPSTELARDERHPFLTALDERVLVGDGGIGTLLYARGAPETRPFEELNLVAKDNVLQVHLDYIHAGAEVIQTNTFGANRVRLGSYGLEDRVWDINVWGAKLARNAREISGENVFIAGSIGPLGKPLAPLGPISLTQARDAFSEQVEGLLAGGVDCFIIETMADPREAVQALLAVREACRLPVILQFSFSAEGEGENGETPGSVLRSLAALTEGLPDVLGLNCSCGPAPMLQLLKQMAALRPASLPLSVYPNAGLPTRVGGRYLYQTSPAYMAQFVRPFAEEGARLIGGCCGTAPEHIVAIRRARDELVRDARNGDAEGPRVPRAAAVARRPVVPTGAPVEAWATVPQPPETPTSSAPSAWHPDDAALAETGAVTPPTYDGGLREKLRRRQFVISVELDPPRGAVAKKFLRGAMMLKEAGVDAVNIADSPMARVRMSHIAGALLVIRQTGMEPIVHFTTRDRNLMGIQSDLLGAHALGIRHILALTGDPPSVGKYAHASAVYDVDSIGLLQILNGLNRGTDVAGNPIGRPTDFTLGCALTPVPKDVDLEVQRFRKKLEQQPHFVMTQPLYELEPLERMLNEVGGCPVPLILGVMPLHSYKHAEYLHNEVPGISIPEPVREALRKAGDDGLRVGMEQAAEIIEQARGMIDGVYICPSFGKFEPVAELVRTLRTTIRPDTRAKA